MSPYELVKKVRAYLSNPNHWIQSGLHLIDQTTGCHKYCLAGAASATVQGTLGIGEFRHGGGEQPWKDLAQALGFAEINDMITFNDDEHTTHEQMLHVLDTAYADLRPKHQGLPDKVTEIFKEAVHE